MPKMNQNQQVLFSAALSSTPPLLTDDPLVNYYVDEHELFNSDIGGVSHAPFNPGVYEAEIRAAKLHGSFLLSYRQA